LRIYIIIANDINHRLAVRIFTILWSGQIASAIGTEMTQFALTIWIWQQTQTTTAIALLSFFFLLPQIAISLVAGLIVDRFNRQHLMIFSDVCVGACTLLIGLLHSTAQLQIWHLYALAVIYGCCGQVQSLAFSASISSIVDRQHYGRVSSMRTLIMYSSTIIAPALVGGLYPTLGLMGIIAIDLATFIVGIVTVLSVRIPQSPRAETEDRDDKTIWQQLFWGIEYIWARPSLAAIVSVFCLFLFAYHTSETLYQPMILARTGSNTQILSTVAISAGIGGVVGAAILSIVGGYPRQVQGMLIAFIGVGAGTLVLGLGQTQTVWMVAQFCAAACIPLAYSATDAMWYTKVPPAAQGRVLAAAHTIGSIVGALASVLAGILADRIFEPLMNSGSPIAATLTPLVGTGKGAGIALLLTIAALMMGSIGITANAFPTLRNAETLLPDCDRPNPDSGELHL
jgi:MFS transporter, DHA3 family, macrolide efflux protein